MIKLIKKGTIVPYLKMGSFMTRRKRSDFIDFGRKVKSHRESLSLERNSREFFLSDRIEMGLINEGDISLKTLTNIENGYTLPSIPTLQIRSTALEVDIFDLISDLLNNINNNNE